MESSTRLWIYRQFLGKRAVKIVEFLCLVIVLFGSSAPVTAQSWRSGQSLYVKVRGGLSGYLGDNNTVPLNPEAFSASGKLPYSLGVEMGYQFGERWSVGVGIQWAMYPLITRFYEDLDVRHDPTSRRSYEVLFRHLMSRRRLAIFTQFGFHLTYGDVNIYEAKRLDAGKKLNRQYQYMYGPLFGIGLDYVLTPHLSFLLEINALVSLMDDSADGRLALGPPQPDNIGVKNRFGTFDLLNAYGFGVTYRPSCGAACKGATHERHMSSGSRRSFLRFSTMNEGKVTALSYYFALDRKQNFFIGGEMGLVPRAIRVSYFFPDGPNVQDNNRFTGAFLGLSTQWYPLGRSTTRFDPRLAATAAIPRQAHFTAGLDYSVTPNWTLGVETRYVACPTTFERHPTQIGKELTRKCEYKMGVGLAFGYHLK